MIGEELIQIVSNNLPQIAEVVASAFGGTVLSAIFQRGNTKTSEFEKLKAGRMDEAIGQLLENGVITYSEYYKARNFSKIAKKADKYFSDKGYSVKKGYEFDWFVRFYEAAGNISDENMQDIWAKILAGEINNPSSYSLRLIDILKNLSKKDAERVRSVYDHAVLICDTLCIPNYTEYMEHCGIKYSDIMFLNELGLIFNDSTITLNVSVTKDKGIFVYNDKFVVLICGDKMKTLRIGQFPFTSVGREFSSLLQCSLSTEDLIKFTEALKEHCKGVESKIHQRIPTLDGSIKYIKSEVKIEIIDPEIKEFMEKELHEGV